MDDESPLLGRREALRRLAAAAAAATLPGAPVEAQAPPKPTAAPPRHDGPRGTLSDPDLIHPAVPWPKVLTPAELTLVAALCDVIIPADEHSPSASATGVPDYINEYVSAPYEDEKTDLVQIRGGLVWLNAESGRRFGKRFPDLSTSQQHQICDDICYLPQAKPEFHAAARFFALFRDLTATAFYTTTAGMKDLRYIGNVPRLSWDGPPPEVLKHAGLS